MACHGIIFDMDGVLCDSEPILAEAAAAMFKQSYQVEVDPVEFRPFLGTGEENYLRGVAAKHEINLKLPEDKRALYQRYLERIPGRLKPVFGVLEFVNFAGSNGRRIAVACSGDRVKVEGNLREIGVPPDIFDAVVSGDEVIHKKPDPTIFELTANRLDLDPADCLIIEDSPAGVEAAKAVGARCLGVTTSFDGQTLREAGADWIADDLATAGEDVVTW